MMTVQTRKKTAQSLIIFYDGQCPLCSAEMTSLKSHDNNNQITLIDLHSTEFTQDYPNISFDKAMQILHGYYQGKILLGLQVTHRAWTLVGKGFWVAPLNWPIFKNISHWVYLLVAKFRHPISTAFASIFVMTQTKCDSTDCDNKTISTGTSLDNRSYNSESAESDTKKYTNKH